MYLLIYFLPKNSQATITQLQELKAFENPTERIMGMVWYGIT